MGDTKCSSTKDSIPFPTCSLVNLIDVTIELMWLKNPIYREVYFWEGTTCIIDMPELWRRHKSGENHPLHVHYIHVYTTNNRLARGHRWAHHSAKLLLVASTTEKQIHCTQRELQQWNHKIHRRHAIHWNWIQRKMVTCYVAHHIHWNLISRKWYNIMNQLAIRKNNNITTIWPFQVAVQFLVYHRHPYFEASCML